MPTRTYAQTARAHTGGILPKNHGKHAGSSLQVSTPKKAREDTQISVDVDDEELPQCAQSEDDPIVLDVSSRAVTPQTGPPVSVVTEKMVVS